MPVSIDEHLAIDLSAEFAGGGELADQDLEIRTGNAVGVPVEGVPGAANHVVDFDVSAGQSAARVEVGHPRVVCGLDRADGGLANGGIRHAFEADGHPAVIGEIRVDREQQAVDAVRGAGTQRGMVEVRRRVDVRRIQRVTGHGGHEVVLVVHDDIEPGAAVARQVGDAQGANQHADVLRHDLGRDFVAFGGRRGDHGAGLEGQAGGGQEQAEQKAIGNHGEIISDSSADKCTRISPIITPIANKLKFVEENMDFGDEL